MFKPLVNLFLLPGEVVNELVVTIVLKTDCYPGRGAQGHCFSDLLTFTQTRYW